jgi:hypothetical protein
MKRNVMLAASLALALSACASLVARTPAQRVYAATNDFQVALVGATVYGNLPRCAAPAVRLTPCSKQEVVETLVRSAEATRASLDVAQALVRQDSGAEAAAAAAEAATKVLKQLVANATKAGV